MTVNNQSISIDPYRECLYTQQWSVTTQKYIGHRQCVDNPCLVGGCTNSIWSCGYPYIPPASSAPRSYGIPPVCVQHPTGPSRGIPCLRLATMACPPPPGGNSGMLGILSAPSATIANNALTFKMPWEWGFAVALMVFFYGTFSYLRKAHDQL